MSAQPVEQNLSEPELADPEDLRPDRVTPREDDGGPSPEATSQPVEVRRNAVVSAVIGVAAGAMATAYLWRAVGTGGLLDWVICALLGVLAVGYLRSLLDARTPLLVADETGVRVRLGPDWRGVPWDAVDRVVVTPRRGVLRDGRLVVHLVDVTGATAGLDSRALRHARMNRRLYGAPLALPLGMTTRLAGDGDVGDRMAVLSQGRTEVVSLLDTPGQVVRRELPAKLPAERPGGGPSPVARGEATRHGEPDDAAAGERGSRRSRRTLPFRVVPAVDGEVTQPVDDPRARPAAALHDPVDPLGVEFEPQPAVDPVIGPELAAARSRVGLTVDELAERTRIRPHVIESIEVDDFAPCGGDFYARGHIRTLARVLGKDVAPMLARFEQRYATAPVSARKVFEAELARGMTGTVRGGGLGGPNWALLVTAVLALVLVWSGVRLFAGEGDEVLETPPPVLGGSAELTGGFGAVSPPDERQPEPLTVRAERAGATIEIRDGEGEVLFSGDLALGERTRVEGVPPLTVSSDDGAAVSVNLAGRERGPVGQSGEPATRVFQASSE